MTEYDANLELYKQAATEAEATYNIPPGMLHRLINAESAWNPNAVSNKGAQGVAQIVAKWHPGVDPTDPIQSIDYAGAYLRSNYDRFGLWDHAVAAYNAGPTAVANSLKETGQLPNYEETNNYRRKVMGDFRDTLVNTEDITSATPTNLGEAKATTFKPVDPLTQSIKLPQLTQERVEQLAGISLPNEVQVADYFNNKPWMWDYEQDTVSGELKNLAAAFTSGAVRTTGTIVKLAPNLLINSSRLEGSPEASKVVDAILPLVHGIDAIEEDFSKNVNRADEQALIGDITEYTREAANQFENGNYLGALGNTLLGAFVGASKNPVAAVTMFTESIPQMYATVVSLGGNTVALASEYSREYYDDFVTTNGVVPTREQQLIINGMGLSGALFETVSDKLLIKGTPKITNGISTLATAIGIPQNSVIRAAARITGQAVGQPTQEALSGAGTELSGQFAVTQDLSQVDTGQVALQSALEAAASVPLQGVRSVGEALKSNTVSKVRDTISTAVNTAKNFTSEQVSNAVDTATQAAENLSESVPRSPEEVAELNPVQQFNHWISNTLHDKREQGVSRADILKEGRAEYSKAVDYMQANTDSNTVSDKDLKDFDNLATVLGVYNQASELSEDIPDSRIKDHIISLVAEKKGDPKAAKEAVESVLYSMKTDYSISSIEAQELLDKANLSKDQRKQVEGYIERVKTLEEVSGDVKSGTDRKFKGVATRSKLILDALKQDDKATAKLEYRKLTNFFDYEESKAKAIRDVLNHKPRIDIKLPNTIKDATFKDDGSIDTFSFPNKIGAKYVIENRGERSLKKLLEGTLKDIKVIRSSIESIQEDVKVLGETTAAAKPIKEPTAEPKIIPQDTETEETPKEVKSETKSTDEVAETEQLQSLDQSVPKDILENTNSVSKSGDISNFLTARKKSDLEDNPNIDEEFFLGDNVEDGAVDTTYIESDAVSLLRTVPNLMGRFNEGEILTDIPKDQKAILRGINKWHNDFDRELKKILFAFKPGFKAVVGEIDNYANNPFLYFINKEVGKPGTINPNVVTALTTAALSWVGSEGRNSLMNNNATINKMVGYDTKSPVNPIFEQDLRYAGTVQGSVAEHIGKQFLKSLGLKGVEGQPADNQAEFELTAGLVAIQVLEELGVIETKKGDSFNQATKDAMSAKFGRATGRNPIFIKVVASPENQIVAAEKPKKVIESYREVETTHNLSTVLDQLFGAPKVKFFPDFEPSVKKKDATYLKGTNPLPEKVRKQVNHAQSVPWRINPAFLGALEAGDKDFFRGLSGYKTELELADAPFTYRSNEKAKNNAIDLEIENIFEFFKAYENSSYSSFYFQYNPGSSGRWYLANTGFNYQSSKLMKQMLTLDKPKFIDPNNAQDMQGYQYAIAQNLGIATDNIPPEAVFRDLTAITNSEAFSILSGEEQVSNEELIQAAKELNKKEPYSAYVAVQQHVRGLEALKAGKKIPNSLLGSADAKTSGMGLSLLVAGTDTENTRNKLNATGVFFDGDYSNYPEWRQDADSNNLDNYEQLAVLWAKAFKRLKETTVLPPTFEALEAYVGELSRAIAKSPVMVSNYGAGIPSIIRNTIEDLVEQFHYDLAKGGVTALNLLDKYGLKNFDIINEPLPERFLRRLRDDINNTYGESLGSALLDFNPEFKEYQESVNMGFNAVAWIFRAVFNVSVRDLADKKGTDVDQLTKKDITNILESESVKHFLPMFKLPESRSPNTGSLFIETVKDYTDNQVQPGFINTKSGRRSRSSYTYQYEYADPGVSGLIRMIHAMDATANGRLLGEHSVLNLYDSYYGDPTRIGEYSQQYHKEVLDITRNYSPINEVNDKLQSVLEIIRQPEVWNKVKSDLTGIIVNRGNRTVTLNEDLKSILKSGTRTNVDKAKDILKFIADDVSTQASPTMQRNRQDFHDQITAIDHSPHLNSSHIVKPEAYENKEDKPNNEEVISGFLKSSEEEIDLDNFEADTQYDLTQENIKDVFNQLAHRGSVKASPSHKTTLSNLLDQAVNPVVAHVQDFAVLLKDRYNSATVGALKNKQIFVETNQSMARTNLEMSAQEVYVHELIHAITKAGIANPQNFKVMQQLNKLQIQTRNDLNRKFNGEGWRAFLNVDPTNTDRILFKISEQDEIDTAKAQFDYIFDDETKVNVNYTDPRGEVKTTQLRRSIFEFVAIGLTNERLNSLLSTQDFTVNQVTSNNTFFGKLEDLFMQLIDRIFRKISRTKDLQGDQALLNLVQELSQVQAKKRYLTKKPMDWLTNQNKAVQDKWKKHALAPLGNLNYDVYKNITSKNDRGVLRNLTAVGTLAAGTILPVTGRGVPDDIFNKAVTKFSVNFNAARKGLIHDIFRQIVPSTDTFNRQLEWLHLRSKNLVDRTHEDAINAIKASIKDTFISDTSDADFETLTLGLLQVDFSALYDKMTPSNKDNLIKLLKNTNNQRGIEINQIKSQLKFLYGESTSNYFINQSRSLGQMMATGNARVKDTGSNAYVIAKGTLLEGGLTIKENDVAEQLIDKLATLYGIGYTTQDTRNKTADIIDKEFDSNNHTNGITKIFGLHKSFKERSLGENFSSNKAMTTKGYITQMYNPHIELRVGLESDKEQMSKDGFIKVGDLPKDYSDRLNSNTRVMYKNDTAGLNRYDKTIMSLNSQTVSGSSIRNGRVEGDIPGSYIINRQNVADINRRNKSAVRRQFLSDNHQDRDDSLLIPSVKEDGSIHDYRYKMSHHNKKVLLEQKLDAADLLARMQASIEYKNNSITINRELVDLLHADFEENFTKTPKEYVKLSSRSTDKEIADVANLMPEDMKQYVKDKFNGDMYVKKSVINIAFGQRRLTAAKKHYPKMIRIIEEVWKEVVSFAKVNIVIKNPAVITANVVSNTFSGLLRGVPIEEMVRGQLKGIRLIHNYQKDLIEMYRLKAEYDSLKAIGEPTGDVDIQIAALKDQMNNSEIKPLIDAGLFQTIVEDINVKPDTNGYVEEFFGKVKMRIPTFLQESEPLKFGKPVVDWAFITRDTGAFKLLLKGTQYSDFVARYAMYNYMVNEASTDNRVSPEEAKRIVLEMYLNYETPTSKYLQFMDDIGLLIFLKYPTRIVRALYSAFKDNPLNALSVLVLEASLNPDTPLDASFVGAWDITRSLGMITESASTLPATHFIP